MAEGTAVARPDHAHSIHVDAEGLPPGEEVWYRFEAGGFTSPTGHARLPPSDGDPLDSLRLGVASCQAYQSGFYTAYRDIYFNRSAV